MAHFLTVDEVLARYRVRDRRAARRIMDEAGAFKVAGRLLVDVADLEAWEARQKERRVEQVPPPGDASTKRARVSRTRAADRVRSEPLAPEWWRESA